MNKARARFGVPEARCFAKATEGFVGIAGDAVARFIARAERSHGAGVADDDDGMKMLGSGWRRWAIKLPEIGQRNLLLVLAAMRAEVGGGGKL